MSTTIDQAINDLLAQFAQRDPKLTEEVKQKLNRDTLPPVIEESAEMLPLSHEDRARVVAAAASEEAVSDVEARLIVETIVRPILRPVLKIRDNLLVLDFFGADSDVWRERLTGARQILDAVIPAVGRVEVTNHPVFTWVGTGWLIDEDVIVTNRHVAREFSLRDNARFVFRMGQHGRMGCRIDFLEEFERTRALEFSALEVLWIAPQSEPDIAFLRVARNSNGTPLPRPVPLAAQKPVVDQFVATIGYPARDDQFPDQDLVRRVFGDVYDKKRLAPGQILESPEREVLHDCSTLGGNSGSVVLDLNSGEAVALHYAGLFPTANYAVPAAVVRDRLRRVLRGELTPVVSSNSQTNKPDQAGGTKPTVVLSNQPASATFTIPLEITVSFGAATVKVGDTTVSTGTPATDTSAAPPDEVLNTAVESARRALANNADVVDVRLGYRFKNDWITRERVIVVEARGDVEKESIPAQYNGVGVEVRGTTLLERLRSEGVVGTLIEERVARGRYRRPTNLQLREVSNEPMQAIFHVSPDSGFPNLKAFLERTQNRITATMYEFEAPHIVSSLLEAIQPANRRLLMVTQKEGTRGAINQLRNQLGNRFEHVWASVGNAISVDTNLLFPKAYHIKVAVRDGKEVWLSSGNWKDSGQPDIDPAGNNQTSWGPLNNNNREWHVVIRNENLAQQFEDYIRYDFAEAHRVPLPEAVAFDLPDIFVPDIAAFERVPEAPAQYFDPLPLNRPLRIQPLLTPDNYIEHITGMIEDAERTIYVQNQSFNLLRTDDVDDPGDNERAFYQLLRLLKDRQETHDVKIIFRHGLEFGPESWESQKNLLDRLQDFGFDMANTVKLQFGCHTKGVIVDSEVVLIGSHNLTNQGALFNRDASLIVYDAEVARYFERIFLFDWDKRARHELDFELPSGTQVARIGESTPQGMRRVSLAEALHYLVE